MRWLLLSSAVGVFRRSPGPLLCPLHMYVSLQSTLSPFSALLRPSRLQGSWAPSMNVPTLLTTIRLLMAHPNGDDGLMPDIVSLISSPKLFWKNFVPIPVSSAADRPTSSVYLLYSSRKTRKPTHPGKLPIFR